VAPRDTSIESRSAVEAPTPRSVSTICPHGARTKSATTGTTTNAAPIAASATIGRGSRVRIGQPLGGPNPYCSRTACPSAPAT
jgi:hypothetical protein